MHQQLAAIFGTRTSLTRSKQICLCFHYFTYGDSFKMHAWTNSLGSGCSISSEAEHVRSVSRAKDQLFTALSCP